MRAHEGPRRLGRALALSSGLLLVATVAAASQVRPINLEEMTERAATIFSGTCIEVKSVHDARLDRTVTQATFRVQRAVKGSPGDTVTVKFLGSAEEASHGEGLAGLPGFRQGEEVVLFLYGESRLGLSGPVGFGQGKFSLVEDKQGRKVAVNEFGNKNLLQGISDGARERLGAKYTEWKSKTDLDSQALLDMAEQLRP